MDTFMPCTRTLGTGASCRLAAQVDILRYQLLAATVSERSGFSEHFPHSLRLEARSKRNTLQSIVTLFAANAAGRHHKPVGPKLDDCMCHHHREQPAWGCPQVFYGFLDASGPTVAPNDGTISRTRD
jgi:hypothetical protein